MEKTGQKTAPDISDNKAVKYGSEAEAPLRELFALDYPELTVEHGENLLLRSIEYPFLQYSPDGELTDSDGRRGLLEIKTTRIASSMAGESWAGQVPQNYYCQIVHGLIVTGYDFVILKAQLKYDYGRDGLKTVCRHYKWDRQDVEEDIQILREAEIKFWEQVEAGTRPALILPEI